MVSIDPTRLSRDPMLRRVWKQMGEPVRCRVVGGWIRDRLLGRATGDLDLTIEGDAEDAAEPARRLASALGVRAHLLGTAPHRVWRMESSGLKVEIWPMGALGHREDMERRDFSINALSRELPDGPLEDLVGGLLDLEAGRLRALSRSNLEDDAVRLLRAPRFLAQLEGFELEGQTRTWISELAPHLATSPRERVGQELTTLLSAVSSSRGLGECINLGLFEPAAPTGAILDSGWLRTNLSALDRVCGAGVPPAVRRTEDTARLAFLFRVWGIPAASKLAPYAWPRNDRENALRAAGLLDEALTTVDASPADRRELAWRTGEAFPSLLALASAVEPLHSGWRRWRRQWQHDPAAITNPTPILSGDEIVRLTGVSPGPELGRLVNALAGAQVRREIRSRNGAIDFVQRLEAS